MHCYQNHQHPAFKDRVEQTFSAKAQILNILGFVGQETKFKILYKSYITKKKIIHRFLLMQLKFNNNNGI